jgi:hypothetical protein
MTSRYQKYRLTSLKWSRDNRAAQTLYEKNYYNNNEAYRERKKEKMRVYARKRYAEKKAKAKAKAEL